MAGSTGADVGTQRVCAGVFTEVIVCCTLNYIWGVGYLRTNQLADFEQHNLQLATCSMMLIIEG